MTNKIKQELDKLIFIKPALLISEGWLIGNSVKNILEDKNPTDFDIIVPSRENFQKVVSYLNSIKNPIINSNGGLKYILEYKTVTLVIDIWCEELSHFLLNSNNINYIYNLKRNLLINKL